MTSETINSFHYSQGCPTRMRFSCGALRSFTLHRVAISIIWYFVTYSRFYNTTDLSVCPTHTHPPIPRCSTKSGFGGRRQPGQRRPRVARRTVGGRRRLEGCVSVAVRTGGLPPGRGSGFARATSISPRTTATPNPTSHDPAMA